MVRSMLASGRLAALLMVAALSGCVAAPNGNAYDRWSSHETAYNSGGYFFATSRQNRGFYRTYPPDRRGHYTLPPGLVTGPQGAIAYHVDLYDSGRVAGELRDWRDGDGAFRRQQRALGGAGLEVRHRRDRQERMLEERRERADRSRRSRDRQGQIEAPSFAGPGISEKFDQDVGRRLQRSTQAERRAQRRAAEVRKQLRAGRQAISEGSEISGVPVQPAD